MKTSWRPLPGSASHLSSHVSLCRARLPQSLPATPRRTVKGVFRQAKRTAQQMAAPTEEWEEAAAAPAAARAAPAGPPAAPQPPAPAPGKRRFWDFGRGVPTAAAAAPSPPAPAAYTPVVVTARGGPAGQYLAGVEGGTPAAAAPALQEPEVSPLVQRGGYECGLGAGFGVCVCGWG